MKSKLLILLPLMAACASVPPPISPADPCVFLTSNDIEAVQGEAPVSSHATSHKSGDTTVSQCFYLMPEQSKSISVEITTSSNLHKTWERQFEPEESGETHAIEVKDVGTDAFWGGNRVSGSLYVLTREGIFKITIGGAGDAATKMERTKTLARKILAALSRRA
jgi:hypothetical protein